jgi:hypothetical protein
MIYTQTVYQNPMDSSRHENSTMKSSSDLRDKGGKSALVEDQNDFNLRPIEPVEGKNQKKLEEKLFLMFIQAIMKYLRNKRPHMYKKSSDIICECIKEHDEAVAAAAAATTTATTTSTPTIDHAAESSEHLSLMTSVKHKLRQALGHAFWKEAVKYFTESLKEKRKAKKAKKAKKMTATSTMMTSTTVTSTTMMTATTKVSPVIKESESKQISFTLREGAGIEGDGSSTTTTNNDVHQIENAYCSGADEIKRGHTAPHHDSCNNSKKREINECIDGDCSYDINNDSYQQHQQQQSAPSSSVVSIEEIDDSILSELITIDCNDAEQEDLTVEEFEEFRVHSGKPMKLKESVQRQLLIDWGVPMTTIVEVVNQNHELVKKSKEDTS